MYREIKPSKNLNQIIDSFWVLNTKDSTECFDVLPDSCTDLIFDINNDNAFVSGAMCSFQNRKIENNSSLLGVRFNSEHFAFLSNIPLIEIKNSRVELSNILSNETANSLLPFKDLETEIERVIFLENFVLDEHHKGYSKRDSIVSSVVQNIRSMKGAVVIEQIAKQHHISLRQLERRFRRSIGLTMKEFSRVIRFINSKRAIETQKSTSLLEIGFNSGFFDHAHMNFEFNRISGKNPSFYR